VKMDVIVAGTNPVATDMVAWNDIRPVWGAREI
jgi:hypothetical protein